MKRQRKCKKRSCSDSNEQMPQEVVKHERANSLEEASAAEKYVPVFGKNAQLKKKPGKNENEEDVGGQMVKIRKVDDLDMDEDSKNDVLEDSLSQEQHVPENDDKTLHHNTPVKDIEKEECLDVSNSYNHCIAQEENKSSIQVDNAYGEDDIKSQMQKYEAEESEIEINQNPTEIKLQQYQTLSIEAATLKEETPIDIKGNDCTEEGFLKDLGGCEETKLNSNATVLSTSQDIANFTEKETNNSSMKDKELVGNNEGAIILMESDSSKKTVVDDSNGNDFNEKQLITIEERPREVMHNTSNNEEKNELANMSIDRLAVDINVTKDKSIDLVHGDSEGKIKVASHNKAAYGDPPGKALVRSNPVTNEDKTSSEDFSNQSLSQCPATEHDLVATHSQGNKICNISDGGISLPCNYGKDVLMPESEKKNDYKGGIADYANMQSFLDYDADVMMTDSQINLLDDDILTLPQSSVHEGNVPDINNKKCAESKKTLDDYIADGEHMMKGIIEEISDITKTIVTMKRFIDSVKKQKQTKINTIWKYGKAN